MEMREKMIVWVVGLAFSFFIGVGMAFADGVIIVERQEEILPPWPRPHPIPKVQVLTVKYHRVTVDITDNIATTSVDQVFKNDFNVELEGTYIFPLPENAAITDFAMYVDGERVSGEILDKDKARRIYEDIVRRMKDPGLLEYLGRNMFKARVYPIPKRGEKRIQLVYQETLKYDAGLYRYVYPLNTERLSPRPLEEVTVSVNIKSKVAIKSVYSPTHEVDTKIGEFEASCGYEAKNVKPQKNFILYYSVSEKEVGLSLLTYRKGREDGYFMLLLSGGEVEEAVIDKEIVFLLDTSGSMKGEKIKQAKGALRFCISSLGKGDRFNVVSFATGVNSYKNTLADVNDTNIEGALDFVDKLKARGGTNINEALITVLKMFTDSKMPRMVVFLTDGQPTVGITGMNDILENLEDANKAKVRIFVFGVGNDVNSHLLDRIAEVHRGVSEYVLPKENIEVKVSSFYRKISEPILSDIKLDFGKIQTEEIYPLILPDIFKGTQVVLLGRYTPYGSRRGEDITTEIILTGYVNGEERRLTYKATFPQEDRENDFVPGIWAMRKVGYLMSEIRLKGENRELIDEIIALSKEYGIMTPYTSFLILERDEDYHRWGIKRENALKMREEGRRYGEAMKMLAGKEAISSAMDIIELKERSTVAVPSMETVKHLADKTFYLQEDGSWIDSRYRKGMRVKKVKYLSDEYFEILRKKPELGKYFAIGENISVVLDGICFMVEK
ncbi:MAG TPA: VWA domain-containing protein [Candidatus Omnitrophica bacterium]|nr:VWA domain-containing protein [Candidatus Omnitrophota bacterium]